MANPTIDWVFYDLDKGVYILNNPQSYINANPTSRIVEVQVDLNNPLVSGVGLYPDDVPLLIKSSGTIYEVSVTNQGNLTIASSGSTINDAFLPLSGGTLSGALYLSGTPVSGSQAATKNYTDSSITSASGILAASIELKADTTYVNSVSGNLQAQIVGGATTTYVDQVGAAAVTSGNSSLTSYSGLAETRFVNTSGDAMSGFLVLHANPTLSGQAATKLYVDQVGAQAVSSGGAGGLTAYSGYAESAFVNTSGDSMTGFLTLHSDPTVSGHAATKQYVDRANYSDFSFGTGGTGLNTTSSTYTAQTRFVFPGTNVVGNIISVDFILQTSTAGRDADARIMDITNNLEKAQANWGTNTAITLVTDSSPTNLPPGQAIFEIQLRRLVGNTTARLHGMRINY